MALKKLIYTLQVVFVALVLSIGVQYAFAAWSGPQNDPPNCISGQAGCDAPIHAGSENQVKPGGLSLNTLNVTAGSALLGNVGIGTVTPASKLEVVGPGIPEVRISSTDGFGPAQLSFYSDRGLGGEWRPGYIISGDNGGYTGRLDFFTNGIGQFGTPVRAMSLVNGNVSLGNEGQRFVFGANIDDTNNSLYRQPGNGSSILTSPVDFGFESYGNRRVTIKGGGNVGIGNTDPAQKLDVTGNIQASGTICANGGTNCIGSSGGTLRLATVLGLGNITLNGSSKPWPDHLKCNYGGQAYVFNLFRKTLSNSSASYISILVGGTGLGDAIWDQSGNITQPVGDCNVSMQALCAQADRCFYSDGTQP